MPGSIVRAVSHGTHLSSFTTYLLTVLSRSQIQNEEGLATRRRQDYQVSELFGSPNARPIRFLCLGLYRTIPCCITMHRRLHIITRHDMLLPDHLTPPPTPSPTHPTP